MNRHTFLLILSSFFSGIAFVSSDEEVENQVPSLNRDLKFKIDTICDELVHKKFNMTANNTIFICKREMLLVVRLLYIDDDEDVANTLLLMKQYEILGLSPVMTVYNDTFSATFSFEPELNLTAIGWSLNIKREIITGSKSVPPVIWLPYKVIIEFPNHLYRTEVILTDYYAEPFLKWSLCCQVDLNNIRKYIHLQLPIEQPFPSSGLFSLIVVHSLYQGIVLGLKFENFIVYYNLASLNNEQICGSALKDCRNLYLLDALITPHYLILVTTKGVLASNNLLEVSSTNEKMSFRFIVSIPEFEKKFEVIKGQKLVELKSITGGDLLTFQNVTSREIIYFTIRDKRVIYVSNHPYTNWESIVLRTDRNETLISVVFEEYMQQFILLELTNSNSSQISLMRYPSLIRLHSFLFPPPFIASNILIHAVSRHIFVIGNEVWISEDGGISFIKIHNLMNDTCDRYAYHLSSSGEIVFMTRMKRILYGKIGIPRLVSMYIPNSTENNLTDYSIFRLFINDTEIVVEEFQRLKAGGFVIENSSMPISEILKENETVSDGYFFLQPINDDQALLYQYRQYENESGVFNLYHIGRLLKHRLGGQAVITDVLFQVYSEFINAVLINWVEPFPPESQYAVELAIEENYFQTLKITTQPSGNNTFSWSQLDEGKTLVFPGFPSIFLRNYVSANEMEGISIFESNASIWADCTGEWYLYSFISDGKSLLELVEDDCKFIMDVYKDSILLTQPSNYIIDLKESLQLTVEVHSLNRDHLAIKQFKLYAVLKNPNLFAVTGKEERKATKLTLRLRIAPIGRTDGITSLIINMPESSLKCASSRQFVVYSFCPQNKVFRFNYTVIPNTTVYNYQNLPVNYRPPSQYGVAVPTSRNIYNADPSLPRWHDKTLMSKATGRYKQCENKTSRQQCGCNSEMEESSLALYSDCKRSVRQLRHLTHVLLNYTHLKQQNQLDWASFVSVEELNERKDYSVLTLDETEIHPNNNYVVSFSQIGQLFLKGSGLYHFRVTLHSDSSKCKLADEFQIYAVPVSLPYPFYYMWNCLVVITTGVVLLATYIWFSIAHPSANRHQRQHQVKSASGQSTTLFSKLS